MEKQDLEIINKYIDKSATILVGVLLKRIEVLKEHNVLTPDLYKGLVKEHIYENSRRLKDILEVYFTVGTIQFKSEKPKQEDSV